MISHDLKKEALKAHSPVAIIPLLEIDWGGPTLIRVARNSETVISDGEEYVPVAFDIDLHPDMPDEPGSARLSVDNVDRAMTVAVRSADEIFVRLKLVSTLDLDSPELDERYKLKAVTVNAQTISGDLVLDDFLWDRWPYGQYSPRSFRGIS